MKNIFYISCISLLNIHLVFCSRILFVAPIPSYSHQIFFRKIWLKLAERGHDLTVLSTDYMENAPKNVRQIDWHFTYQLRHNKYNISQVYLDNEDDIAKVISVYITMLNEISDRELSQPDVQQLLKNRDEKFDLLIAEFHHPLVFAFSSYFNCPYIGISSANIDNSFHELLGNPAHPLLYPSIFSPLDGQMTFRTKVDILTFWIKSRFNKYSHGDPYHDELARKHFGSNLPPMLDIIRNVSLVLINTHVVFDDRPLLPGLIRIGGGTHLEPAKALPHNIQEFLDDAPEGAIYFSLGTNVKSTCLKPDTLNAFIEAFRELPFKVLWRFEDDLKNVSTNVKIFKWLPQSDVLRHKNVKAFITQGGLQSIDESIFSYVPMIVIPFVSDQKLNARNIKRKGLGVYLDKSNLDKECLKQAILEVISNQTYKTNVKNIANYIEDQPMSGLDTAIWWIEYVIRHKGTKHLWNFDNILPLYEYLMLDVIFYMIFINLTPLYLAYILGKFFIRRIYFNYIKQL